MQHKPELLARAIWLAAPMLPHTRVHNEGVFLCRLDQTIDHLLQSNPEADRSRADEPVSQLEAMRRKLPEAARENGAFDPAGEEHAYLRAAADDHVFLKNEDVHALVARCKSPAALLDLAIRFEKDSLVYYGAMKKLVPHAEGLDALIAEEQRHVETLAAQRAKAAG